MKREFFWDCGAGGLSKVDDAVERLVSKNVKAAYKHIFKTGALWLDYEAGSGKVQFEFTDEDYVFRKVFDLDGIRLCGIESQEDAAAAIAYLESFIALIKVRTQSTLEKA